MYTPLQIKDPYKTKSVISLMAQEGVDKRTLSQLLDTKKAQIIDNYIVTGDGYLATRGGLSKLFDSLADVEILMMEEYTEDIILYAYGTTLSAYEISTGTHTVIKNDFTGATFEGQRVGDYFFVTNQTDGLWYAILSGTWSITNVATAPNANVIKLVGNRLYLGDLDTDSTAVKYSSVDDGTNPPCTVWTDGTDPDDPGTTYYRAAGTVRSIEGLGSLVIVFADKGKWGFQVTYQDLGGTAYKIDDPVFYRQDFGGGRGAVTTPAGLIYANEAGLWQLVSVGQDDIDYSDQEYLKTAPLGDDYFENADMSSCSIVYDAKRRYVYLSYAQDSETNNTIVAWNVDTGALSKISGWNIARFLNVNGTIYGASAVKAQIDECFSGSTDNGVAIGTEYKQELNLGDLTTSKNIQKGYIQGFLSESSSVKVRYDVYDKEGIPTTDKRKFEWTAQYNLNGGDGWGSAEWGDSAWGGDFDYADLIESFDGCKIGLRNIQRVILHITSLDKVPHKINWTSIQGREKGQIRRRKMTRLT